MNLYRSLVPRAVEQHSLVTPADARAVGATGIALVQLAHRGVLERIAQGIYRVPELARDPLQQHQEALLRFSDGALSHETALDLHDLCDINPVTIHIALPRRLRVRTEVPRWLTIHRRDLSPDDLTWHEGLRIVTPARAIIDGIETNIGQRFIDEAIAAARLRNLLSTREASAIEQASLTQRLRFLAEAQD